MQGSLQDPRPQLVQRPLCCVRTAGMRELWQTGWMQQSIRMVAAAFLTEYLNLSWTEGAAWFHDTLVDADLAINSMMWQNAGKSGLDQWNFTLLPTSKSQVCVGLQDSGQT